MALAADNYGLALQRRIEELFDGDEEGIHIHVKNGLRESRHGS